MNFFLSFFLFFSFYFLNYFSLQFFDFSYEEILKYSFDLKSDFANINEADKLFGNELVILLLLSSCCLFYLYLSLILNISPYFSLNLNISL